MICIIITIYKYTSNISALYIFGHLIMGGIRAFIAWFQFTLQFTLHVCFGLAHSKWPYSPIAINLYLLENRHAHFFFEEVFRYQYITDTSHYQNSKYCNCVCNDYPPTKSPYIVTLNSGNGEHFMFFLLLVKAINVFFKFGYLLFWTLTPNTF